MVSGQGLPPDLWLHLPGRLHGPDGRAPGVHGRGGGHGRRRPLRPEALADDDRHDGLQRQRGPVRADLLGVQLRLRGELRQGGALQALQSQPLQHVHPPVPDDHVPEDSADDHGRPVLLRRDPEDVRRRHPHALQAHGLHRGHGLALPVLRRAGVLLRPAGGGSLHVGRLRLRPALLLQPGHQDGGLQAARGGGRRRGGPELPHRLQPDDGLHPRRGAPGEPAEQGRPGDVSEGP
mmetsp:Transcript_67567/g.177191  ORF Transcript_67567/g.177191 Transcript_67567/m.177191 type:complete len:235 (+) Transcript_67567:735-1439(+)